MMQTTDLISHLKSKTRRKGNPVFYFSPLELNKDLGEYSFTIQFLQLPIQHIKTGRKKQTPKTRASCHFVEDRRTQEQMDSADLKVEFNTFTKYWIDLSDEDMDCLEILVNTGYDIYKNPVKLIHKRFNPKRVVGQNHRARSLYEFYAVVPKQLSLQPNEVIDTIDTDNKTLSIISWPLKEVKNAP